MGRCPPDLGFAAPIVVTGHLHLEHVEAQLGEIAGGRKCWWSRWGATPLRRSRWRRAGCRMMR
ncbi:hypothetical protein ACFSTD_24290 [Novosphingobium colocasiae]